MKIMQTKICKSCQSEIHKDAKICPNCRTKQKTGIGWKIAAILVIVTLFKLAMDADKAVPKPVKAAKTPEQIERDKIDEAAFQADVLKVKALKAAMKNPASFELVGALRVDKSGVLCVVYRATNSFNAVITEMKAINKNMRIVDWNSQCAGQPGEDMKRIRHAI